MVPITPLSSRADTPEVMNLLSGTDFKEDLRIVNSFVRAHGRRIPPLVNAYMALSPTMRMFGTAINTEFGDVEESGIFLTIAEIFQDKKERHIDTYSE